jgi:MSHA biogenesis protein MshP
MIKTLSASSNSTIYQIYGLRAQQAGKAGIEELMSASFPVDGSVVSCNASATSGPSFSDVRGLNGCYYDASCNTQTITFNGTQHLNFKFSSTGTCQINSNVVTRTLSVDAVHQITP